MSADWFGPASRSEIATEDSKNKELPSSTGDSGGVIPALDGGGAKALLGSGQRLAPGACGELSERSLQIPPVPLRERGRGFAALDLIMERCLPVRAFESHLRMAGAPTRA